MDDFTTQIFSAIASHQMLKNGDTVIVACSGGADSVTLLHFLFSHAKQLGITLRAAHVNHGLRGKAADEDEAFVTSLCLRLDIPLDVKRVSSGGACSEQWGRQLRYRFFEELCAQHSCAKLATAHTLNDNAETVLLHLARGAGLQGACGIPAVRGNIIRPLLGATRAQIEAYAAHQGLSFCTDATNVQMDYARNRVRACALPALESVNPQACFALTRFAQHAAQATDFLQQQADLLLQQAQTINRVGEMGYHAQLLAQAHPAVRAAALQSLIAPHADVTQTRLALADATVHKKSGAVQLSSHAVLCAAQGVLRVIILPKTQKKTAERWEKRFVSDGFPQAIVLPSGQKLCVIVNRYEKTVNFTKNHLNFVADYGKLMNDAIFRTGRTGDTFVPMRGNGTKPLKKLYSEAKISVAARSENPVLASGNTVLWVLGFGFSALLAIDAATQEYLQIEIKGGFLPHNIGGGSSDEQTHGK